VTFGRRSQARSDECNEVDAEMLTVAELVMEADVHARAEKIEHIKRVAQDPANLEGPATFPGAPALVSDRRSDRLERPDEVIQRLRSNPWRDASGPLAHRVESAAGLAARAHTAIEAQEERLTH